MWNPLIESTNWFVAGLLHNKQWHCLLFGTQGCIERNTQWGCHTLKLGAGLTWDSAL